MYNLHKPLYHIEVYIVYSLNEFGNREHLYSNDIVSKLVMISVIVTYI